MKRKAKRIRFPIFRGLPLISTDVPSSRIRLLVFSAVLLPLIAPQHASSSSSSRSTGSRGTAAERKGLRHGLLVGYFGQWGVYEKFFVKNLVTSGGAAELDQINYAQGFVTGGHCSVADPNADLHLPFTTENSVDGTADLAQSNFKGNFHQLQQLKRRYPKLKVLISLEGKAVDFAADAQPEAREEFVRSCVDIFLRGRFGTEISPIPDQPRLFDGIDLDWEYPKQEDAQNFIDLLHDFRQQMDAIRPGLRLTVAVGPSPRMYPSVDLAEVSRTVDQIGIMNYDYNGPWSKTTGFVAPLYTDGPGGSVERSILAFKEAGVPAGKLLMGLPFYGYGWSAVGQDGNGLFQSGKGIRSDRPYSYLQSLMAPPKNASSEAAPPVPSLLPAAGGPSLEAARNAPDLKPTTAAKPFVLYRDPRSKAPWLYDGDTFWTYEDPTSVRFKVGFAMQEQLAGVMAWELSEDAADASLLKAARSGMHPPAARR